MWNTEEQNNEKNIISCVARIQGVTLQLVLFHMKFVPFSKCITSWANLAFVLFFHFFFLVASVVLNLTDKKTWKQKNHFKFPKRGPCCVWLSSSIVKNAIAFPQYVQKICGFSPTTSPALYLSLLVIKSILPPRDYSLYVQWQWISFKFPRSSTDITKSPLLPHCIIKCFINVMLQLFQSEEEKSGLESHIVSPTLESIVLSIFLK